VDYLGVSLDALMIFCPPEYSEEICKRVRDAGIEIDIIGEVNENKDQIKLVREEGEAKLFPKFRESAYTPVKQVIGEKEEENVIQQMAQKIEICADQALQKRIKFVNLIKEQ